MQRLLRSGAAIAALALGGCLDNPFSSTRIDTGDARLGALPAYQPLSSTPVGTVPLGLGGARDAILYVPASYDAGTPSALAVLLHGSGGDAASMLATQQEVADTIGILLLSIDSRAYTWDAILSRFDRDPPFITTALGEVVRRYNVDRRRIGLVGFSDGASYALGLGRANGDTFRRVVAHSPGLVIAVRDVAAAAFYVAHGVQDPILPFGITRDLIVPPLRILGHEVKFVEFEGGHVMRRVNISESLRWIAAP